MLRVLFHQNDRMDRSRLTNLDRSRFEKERTHYKYLKLSKYWKLQFSQEKEATGLLPKISHYLTLLYFDLTNSSQTVSVSYCYRPSRLQHD